MALELLKSKTGRTLIESHRGIEGEVPENSWPAIQLGYELGADLIEVDVQLSSDNVPFIRHNYRLPDGRWTHDVSWNELKKLDIEGETLPKLEDVLVWARETGAHLSLDIKTFFKQKGNLVKEVLRLLQRTDTKDNVLLLFFDHHELFHTKMTFPDVMVRALVTGRLVDFAGYLKSIKADSVSVSYGILCPEDIAEIHSVDIALALVEYWNSTSDFLQRYEVDILSAGNPIEAKRVLKLQQ